VARKQIRCGFISKENVDQERHVAFSSVVKRLLRCEQALIEAFFWGLEQGMLKRKESFSSISGEKTELL